MGVKISKFRQNPGNTSTYLVDLGEDVLESTIVLLQDRVLGGEVEWISALERILERGVGKVPKLNILIMHTYPSPSKSSKTRKVTVCKFVSTS